MSLTNLKIIRGEEIRKVNRLPETFSDLQAHLQNLFSNSAFQITYQDEQGDFITVSNTEELLDAYQRYQGSPSIKLFIRDLETSSQFQPSVQDEIESLRESLASFRAPELCCSSKASQKEEKEVELAVDTQNTECLLQEDFEEIAEKETEIVPEELKEFLCEEYPCEDENPCEEEKENPQEGFKRKRKGRKGAFQNKKLGMLKEKRAQKLFNNPTFRELLREEVTDIVTEMIGEEHIKQENPRESQSKCPFINFFCGPNRGPPEFVKEMIRSGKITPPPFVQEMFKQRESASEPSQSFQPRGPPPFVQQMMKQGRGPFQNCESGRPRGPPPFVQQMIRQRRGPFQNSEFNRPCGPPPFVKNLIETAKQNFPGIIKSFSKAMNKKAYKAKIIEKVTFKKGDFIAADNEYVMVWMVKNNGNKIWPENATLVFKKGNVEALDEVTVPQLNPGETTEISVTFKAPSPGKAFGVWKIHSDQKSFGKLKLKVQALGVTVEETEKVKQLLNLGFTVEQAVQGLQDSDGNIESAVSMIFKNIQQFR